MDRARGAEALVGSGADVGMPGGDDSASADSVVTVEFREDGDRTTVVLTHDGISDEQSRQNHGHGWNACLDNLGARVFGG